MPEPIEEPVAEPIEEPIEVEPVLVPVDRTVIVDELEDPLVITADVAD